MSQKQAKTKNNRKKTDPAPDLGEVAKKQRHVALLDKVRRKDPLTPAELREFAELELKKAGNGTGEQIIRTQKEAAAFVGRNERTIRRWKREGMPTTAEGFYLKSFLNSFAQKEGGDNSEAKRRAQAAEADYKEIKTRLITLELQLKQGKLISIEEIRRGRVERIVAIKRAFLGLGRKVAPRIARMKDPAKITKLITTEIKNIIEGFIGAETDQNKKT